MQRNMDLVRMILMRLEASPNGWPLRDIYIQSFSPQEIGYHAHIMMQEGLIEASDRTTLRSTGPEADPRSLTWKGHEFLDLARDQDRWNRAKAIIAKVGGAPLSVWMKVLTDLTLQGVEAVTTEAR
ncbi:MAG: DUF2513 domain-containing protein [Gemmataceae bacterium]|nr:DUF2513 domain-containing protein [Gemmataceae bacterium]